MLSGEYGRVKKKKKELPIDKVKTSFNFFKSVYAVGETVEWSWKDAALKAV